MIVYVSLLSRNIQVWRQERKDNAQKTKPTTNTNWQIINGYDLFNLLFSCMFNCKISMNNYSYVMQLNTICLG